MSPRLQGGKMRMIDSGTLSPKVAWPTAILALAGIALMILDATGLLDLEDGVWIALLSAGGVTFGAGYSARPGAVIPDPEGHDGERGYADLSLLIQLIAFVIVIVLAVWLIRALI